MFCGMDKGININKYIIYTCNVMLRFLVDASNSESNLGLK
jgi:hypothetical protein